MAIDDGLAKPLADYTPSSSAFVTFRSPEIARLAVRKMGRHPSRRLCCNVAMAPDYRDLEWVNLGSVPCRCRCLADARVPHPISSG